MSAEKRWEAIKTAPNIQAIDAIDKDTPWQEVEPEWWLEMMEVKRRLLANTSGITP